MILALSFKSYVTKPRRCCCAFASSATPSASTAHNQYGRPVTATLHWHSELTALSSIVHAGDTRGTDTLLRRETVITPTGPEVVPLISGNALRGRLRRVGEELLRDTLQLEGSLPLSAAYALRNGGSLHKTGSEPLSGRRRAEIRTLVPQIGVFGCATGGTIIDGCLQVGKVVPHVSETAHLTGVPSPTSAFDLVQMEEYTHADDLHHHTAPTPDSAETDPPNRGNQMRYAVETFPAGTRFSTHFRLARATDLQIAFFTHVLATFTATGQIGGRLAIGHGRVHVTTRTELVAGQYEDLDWRNHLTSRRDTILTALQELR